MSSNLSSYWRRAFHRQVVVAVAPDSDAGILSGYADERRAGREWDAYKLREKRITRAIFAIVFVLVIVAILAGCGGGDASQAEIDAADAALATGPANHPITIGPVSCGGGNTCR